MRPLNRAQPLLPASRYDTFQIVAPLATHHRYARCDEVDCPQWRLGWRTLADESTSEGQRIAHTIRGMRHRRWTECRDPVGVTVFAFEPGQWCFRCPPPSVAGRRVGELSQLLEQYAHLWHRKLLDRQELYLHGIGDHRLYDPRQAYRHDRPENWTDEFANHQDRLATRLHRG